ncbi:G-protein coupled receptor family C group 6 member A isoform X1 [Lepisosteus oculatus]|uniref:G-protein coupled receptor family C group 6 member A isoform X1 n=1 Tax=Lepisosteus oculatus TaxID=7918 RepID=UPI0035F50F90
MSSWLLWLWFISRLCQARSAVPTLIGTIAPGDIVIGGLFPVHQGVVNRVNLSQPQAPACTKFDIGGFTQLLAMIHAIEEINNSSLLDGLKLGYEIYDSCSDVTTAIRATMTFINTPGNCAGAHCSTTECNPKVKAVVGDSHSEISIAVARLLNQEMIPQISYASSAVILSDKTRFPAFMRTIPNDNYQTKAMAKLIERSGWNWIGVISTDGDYGRSAVDSFVSHAAKLGICVAFKEILPDLLSDRNIDTKINQTVETIRSNNKVKVIVSFARPLHMIQILHFFNKQTLNKIWFASDGWSTSKDAFEKHNVTNVETVVGFTFKNGSLDEFYTYLKNLKSNAETVKNNIFLKQYALYGSLNDTVNLTSLLEKDFPPLNDTGVKALIDNTYPDDVYSIQMTINAIAYALVNLCKEKNCKNGSHVQPWELLDALKKTEFKQEGKTYMFNSDGDINSGYNVVLWKTFNGVINMYNSVAEYVIENDTFTFSSNDTKRLLDDLRGVISKCSNSCTPGQVKKTAEGQHTCCYECINCTENQYSNNTDMLQCYNCDTSVEWSLPGSSNCTPKLLEYFSWNDGFAIFLLGIAALGMLVVVVIGIIFMVHRQTPVVKASGGPICYVILLSLMISFISSFFFVGEPSNPRCKVRQVLFGLSFACCVSCILVKSLKIILAFQFNPEFKNFLKKTYKPYVIVPCCVGIQVIICTMWLVFKSPEERKLPLSTTILVECEEGSYVAYGVMLGYIALLALICFICAFKGRKLPEKYNEAKFITFGMLIYFISWVFFIPVYLTTTGKYLPAVEMVVILISNYGILCCHFFPKCYVILFKKENNTKDAFLQNIFEYSKKSASLVTLPRPDSEKTLDAEKTTDPMSSTHRPSCSVLDKKTLAVFRNFDKITQKQCAAERKTDDYFYRKRFASI